MPGHLQHDGIDPGLQCLRDQSVLEPQMNPAALKQILAHGEARPDRQPQYMGLLLPNWYEQHILRRPFAEWPEPVLAPPKT